MSRPPANPRVSVCMPAYNARTTLPATLDSLWAQTLQDFELIVVDDASTDSTFAYLSGLADRRVTALRNDANRKAPATGNRALALARAPYVKFLDSDDLLKPGNLAALSAALDAHPSASMAFCRRDMLLDDPTDLQSRAWADRYREPSAALAPRAGLNSGRELLGRWLRGGMPGNWVGEPVTVMARTAAARAVGGFEERALQDFDFSLWCKLMLVGDVVFLDEVEAVYRVRAGSITRDNKAAAKDWLDRAWIAEGLAAHDPGVPGLSRVRRRALRRALADLREAPITKARAEQFAGYVAAIARNALPQVRSSGGSSEGAGA